MFNAAAILFLEQTLKKGVLFIATLLMAYFLKPDDFGMIAIAVFIVGLSNSFVESGMKDAIIRTENLSDNTLSTAYWINNGFAISVYLLILFLGSLIADFYDREILADILPIIALTTLLFSQQVVPLGVIHKNMTFGKVVNATIPAALISSAIAVFLAYAGYGMWALVIQVLVNTSITSYLIFQSSSFRPTLKFEKNIAKDLLSFGVPLFLANIVSTTSKNLMFLVPGKLLGVSISGFIYMADKIMETIMSQIVYSVQQASYPVLTNYSKNANELKIQYSNILSITSTGVTAILGFLFVTASSITSIFFSEKWTGLDFYIMSLALAYCLYPIHSLNLNILKVMGKTKLYLYLDIYKLALSAFVITLTSAISVNALLIGIIALSVANIIPNGYFTKRLIGYGYIEQVNDYLKSATIPIASSISVYLITYNIFQPGVRALAFSIILYMILITIGLYITSSKLLIMALKAIRK